MLKARGLRMAGSMSMPLRALNFLNQCLLLARSAGFPEAGRHDAMEATMSLTDAMTIAKPKSAPKPAFDFDTKPSLIGLTREEMAAALKEKGVSDKQVKMRVSQLWNWLYVRGV